jgi:hypothetical protein
MEEAISCLFLSIGKSTYWCNKIAKITVIKEEVAPKLLIQTSATTS